MHANVSEDVATILQARMAELIASLRAINPHIKIAYHTDGVVYPIIPD